MRSVDSKLRITVDGKELFVEKGTMLSDILDMEKPCGGKGSCGKCRVRVNKKEELACRYKVENEIEVETEKNSGIFSLSGCDESGNLTENLCFALDIGTTTLALALVSLDEKRVVKVTSSVNPQRAFGADVISRIDHCAKNGIKKLQSVLIAEINKMIKGFGVKAEALYLSGNLTMLHTFFGVDCSSMGFFPYTPAFTESKREKAQVLGIEGVEEVISLPSVSAFVGADVVAGLYSIPMPEDGKFDLLVDLGTNAEIVLFSRDGGIAASAAAGPCFEGANISCGMSATDGAICSFELNYGHISYKTVGDAEPRGICGTGLIDIVHELLKNSVIDETGYMDEDYRLCKGIILSRDDVRQYQLAKSAIYSAILTLMKALGVGFDDISRAYVSGGFSAMINVNSAVGTGLLPKELKHKTVALNNSSLQGTVKFSCEGADVSGLARRIKYIDLSENAFFAERFVDNMNFDVQ